MQKTIFYGVLAGVSTIFIYTLAYLWDKSSWFHPALYWGILPVYLGFMWMAVKTAAQRWERAPSLRELVRPTFLVFVIASLIFWIFYFLVFTFDTDLTELARLNQLEALEQLRQWQGEPASGGFFEQEKSRIEEEGGRFTGSHLLQSLAQSLIGGFLLALGMAFVAKRQFG